MATIKINGTELQPQPAQDIWEDTVIDQVLDGTDAVGALKAFVIEAPVLAGQVFNWRQFENQILASLQTYAPGDLPTGADVIYSDYVASGKISRYRMPVDQTVTGVTMRILVAVP
jgi:hypothetical protein